MGEGVQLEYSRKREDLRLREIPRMKTSVLKACFPSLRVSYLLEESLGILPLASAESLLWILLTRRVFAHIA